MSRTFTDKPAVREGIPLLIGLSGASGSGKTMSALELATGIQQISGGEIFVIDTESRRALHYAEDYTFRHLDFEPPFGSLDYLAAIEHCVARGAKIIVIDSMSHEHEGPGGLIDFQEKEVERMAGDDWQKRERVKMAAWIKPKAARRKLRIGILQTGVHMIWAFRAKEVSKPVKNAQGKQEVVNIGFMPISGDEFTFEATASILLMPHSDGVPTWRTDNVGEKLMLKLPKQFRGILDTGAPLSRAIGRQLAEWARGSVPARTDIPSKPQLLDLGSIFKRLGFDATSAPAFMTQHACRPVAKMSDLTLAEFQNVRMAARELLDNDEEDAAQEDSPEAHAPAPEAEPAPVKRGFSPSSVTRESLEGDAL